jgi:hypothetical protein
VQARQEVSEPGPVLRKTSRPFTPADGTRGLFAGSDYAPSQRPGTSGGGPGGVPLASPSALAASPWLTGGGPAQAPDRRLLMTRSERTMAGPGSSRGGGSDGGGGDGAPALPPRHRSSSAAALAMTPVGDVTTWGWATEGSPVADAGEGSGSSAGGAPPAPAPSPSPALDSPAAAALRAAVAAVGAASPVGWDEEGVGPPSPAALQGLQGPVGDLAAALFAAGVGPDSRDPTGGAGSGGGGRRGSTAARGAGV